jgi:hypothetical protein
MTYFYKLVSSLSSSASMKLIESISGFEKQDLFPAHSKAKKNYLKNQCCGAGAASKCQFFFEF